MNLSDEIYRTTSVIFSKKGIKIRDLIGPIDRSSVYN